MRCRGFPWAKRVTRGSWKLFLEFSRASHRLSHPENASWYIDRLGVQVNSQEAQIRHGSKIYHSLWVWSTERVLHTYIQVYAQRSGRMVRVFVDYRYASQRELISRDPIATVADIVFEADRHSGSINQSAFLLLTGTIASLSELTVLLVINGCIHDLRNFRMQWGNITVTLFDTVMDMGYEEQLRGAML